MKCAVCGKEFGSGEVCQSCGADKFTGLGNYSGYDAPHSEGGNGALYDAAASVLGGNPIGQQFVPQPNVVAVESIVCYACGEIIPADSKFCPFCSQSLWVQCPKCGKTYSSQYPVCSECGTNRAEFEADKQCRELEKQQQKELERVKHEEWLKSPEGQAEMERRIREEERRKEQIRQEKEKQEAQKEAEQIRSELEGGRIGCIGSIIFFFLSMEVGGWLLTLLMPRNSPDIVNGIVMGAFCVVTMLFSLFWVPKYITNYRIKRWKEEHPNHRAIPYL